MAIGFTYAHNNGNGTNATVNLGGTAAAGDILIIMTVGGVDGGGLDAPEVVIGGASPAIIPVTDGDMNIDTGDEERRAILSYVVCDGGENQVFAVWDVGCNFGVEVLWISDPGSLNEVYVIDQGSGGFNPGSGHIEVTGGNPSSDGEVYVGFTHNGRHSYSYAGTLLNGSNVADSGDGFDQSGAVKGIFHHISNAAHTTLASDDVGYATNIMTSPYMGVLGVRIGPTKPLLFGDHHYGGNDNLGDPARELIVDIGRVASAGDWLLVGSVSSAGGSGFSTPPALSDNIDTGGTDWVLDVDAGVGTYGSGGVHVTYWIKECVGGETTVHCDYGASTNKALAGLHIPASDGVLYQWAHNSGNWDGLAVTYTTGGVHANADGQEYFTLVVGGGSGAADPTGGTPNYFTNQGGSWTDTESAHLLELATGECFARAGYDTADGNTTADQVVVQMTPNETMYVGVYALSNTPVAPPDMVFEGCDYFLDESGGSSGTTKGFPNTPAGAGDLLMVFICSPDRSLATPPTGYSRLGAGKQAVNGLFFDVFYKFAAGGETDVTVDYGQNTAYAGHVRWYSNVPTASIYEVDCTVASGTDIIKVTQSGDATGNFQPYITAAAFLGNIHDGVTGSQPSSGAGGNFGNVSPGDFNEQPFGGLVEADDLDNSAHSIGDRFECSFIYNTTPDPDDLVGYFIAVGTPPPSDPPVNTVSPFIDNTSPTVGDVLTGDPGTWTGDGSITFTYQWLNYDGSDHNISGETDITYTVQAGDVGKAIWLDVRAHSEFVDEPGVEAESDHTDNVVDSVMPVDYTDAATVHLTPVVSGVEHYTVFVPEVPAATTVFDVGDHSPTIYVRANRGGIITVATTDNDVTFVLQTSPDGEAWYTAVNESGDPYTYAVTTDTPTAFLTPPGWFHLRLLCTVAGSGPATVVIGTSGGY